MKYFRLRWIFIVFSLIGSQALHEPAAAFGSHSSSGTPVIPTTRITAPDRCSLTLALFKKISVGMTRGLVEEVLCGPGLLISSSAANGNRFTVNKWEGESYKAIILAFKNDRVISKSQVGLK